MNLTKNQQKEIEKIPKFRRWNNYKRHEYNTKLWQRFWTKVYSGSYEDEILDFGCGPCWGSFIGQSNGHTNIHNLDIIVDDPELSPYSYFTHFHKILKQQVDFYNGEKFPYGDDVFNAVISKASLSKLLNSSWEVVISELCRVTKPNGVWYIAPPYMKERLMFNIRAKYVQTMSEKNIRVITWDWGWKDEENRG